MRSGWVFTSAPSADCTVCMMQTDRGYCTLEVEGPDDVHDALILLTKHCFKFPALDAGPPTLH